MSVSFRQALKTRQERRSGTTPVPHSSFLFPSWVLSGVMRCLMYDQYGPGFNPPPPSTDVTYDFTQPAAAPPLPPRHQAPPVIDFGTCDHCGDIIEFGDPSLDLFPGVMGRGKRTGKPMTVDEDDTTPGELHTVHMACAVPYIMGDDYVENPCPACGDAMSCPSCDEWHCSNCDIKSKP